MTEITEIMESEIKYEGNNFNQNERTLYVAGLTRDTTDNDIEKHFLSFGKVDLINHKINLVTRESRGFAFVTFKNMEDLENAMNTMEHYVKNKKVVIKKAQPKQGIIFVGNLPTENELSDKIIKEHFSRYGVVDGIKHPADKARGGKKPFCFVYFQSADTAKALINKGRVVIENFTVEIGRASLNPSTDFSMLARSPQMPFSGNIAAYGHMPGYSGIPFGYGAMPYGGGYMPAMPHYGGFDPSMQVGFNTVMPAFAAFGGRGRGRVTRGRGGMRGQRSRPY